MIANRQRIILNPKKVRSRPGKITQKAPLMPDLIRPLSNEWVRGSGNIMVYEADALSLLQALPDECIDLAVLDPPYESLEKHRNRGRIPRLVRWFDILPNQAYWQIFAELYRVMRRETFIFVFCDQETRDIIVYGYHPDAKSIKQPDELKGPLLAAGFRLWKNIAWEKQKLGMGYHFRAQHEYIVFAEKLLRKNKHRQLNDLSVGDVLSFERLRGKQYYPTEKPYELIELLIKQGSNENELVLDCFAGSGVVGQVCKQLNRCCILGDVTVTEILKRV